MITEIVDSSEERPDDLAPSAARHGWRRTALAVACPLLVGGAAVDAVAAATPADPSTVSTSVRPHLSPTATPCPTPRALAVESQPQTAVPAVPLANHQPCNHHEGMVTAFRWL